MRSLRYEASHRGQNGLADELPDRFSFQLLRSYLELVHEGMSSGQHRLRFVWPERVRGRGLAYDRPGTSRQIPCYRHLKSSTQSRVGRSSEEYDGGPCEAFAPTRDPRGYGA